MIYRKIRKMIWTYSMTAFHKDGSANNSADQRFCPFKATFEEGEGILERGSNGFTIGALALFGERNID